jgi:hypothetical protein
MTLSETVLQCLDDNGRAVGRLRIVQGDQGPQSVRYISKADSRHSGEEGVQLLEGRVYDFVLEEARPGVQVRESSVIKPNRISKSLGRIEPGLDTGFIVFQLEDSQTGKTVATGAVEVLSTKMNYREDYRGMLTFIAAESSRLLYDIRAAGRLRLRPDFKKNRPHVYQQFEFLAAEVGSQKFQAALGQILGMPHQRLRADRQEVPIMKAGKTGRDFSRQLASPGSRMILPKVLGLSEQLHSIPRVVTRNMRKDTSDTPENRFVKHVFLTFEDFLTRFENSLGGLRNAAEKRFVRRISELREILLNALNHELFKSVGRMDRLPTGSPVLHRKAGYRQILESWSRFQAGAQLNWSGGDDVYSAGKKDIASLYEYWLFFLILRLFREKFSVNSNAMASLFRKSNNGMDLLLKGGRESILEGGVVRYGRKLRVRFAYNLTQGADNQRKRAGSWTRQMRPDYTLSFWPEEFDVGEAEAQELAVHIHFDAKYRVDNITELFGNADEDLTHEKYQQRSGNYKRADLLKMHAYRDAIRRSEGAYVLYPGAEDDLTDFRGFHEILPGLGAFSISPGPEGEGRGLRELAVFFDEVVDHVCNRASARERLGYHRFDVYGMQEQHYAESVGVGSERDISSGLRSIPVSEHQVIVAWCHGEEFVDWYRRAGLYNLRAGTRLGSVRLDPELAGARHVLLHGKNGKAFPGLLKITNRGPRIFTGKELASKGYPKEVSSEDIYAVFNVESDSFYSGWEWDFSALASRKKGRSSGQAFTASLAEVLSCQRKE